MSEIRIKSQGAIKLFESDNTSSVTIASPASLSANRTITIPDADVTLGAGVSLSGSTNNTVATVTGANALVGESNLTFDGTRLGVGASADLGYGIHVRTADSGGTVDGGADELVLENSGHTGMTILSGTTSTGSVRFGDSGTNDIGRINYDHNTNDMIFNTNGTEAMRITSSGEVLIKQSIYAISDTNTGIQFDGSDRITFHTGGNEVMKFQANRTAQINGGTGRESTVQIVDGTGTGYEALSTKASSTGNATQIAFRNPNGTVGYINTSGTATSYGTSSDYRLKENVSYDFDATTRLKQLKPARFNFIADADKTVDGFLAHEVSSIVPEAISGEKDALEKYRNADETPEGKSVGDNKLDENGDTMIDAQSIDQSKLVPLLVKTIQELEARITTLENA